MKRALCVGINRYPQPGMALLGCVNDAHAWAALLADHYDFPRSDIRVLADEEATHDTILQELERLVTGSSHDDVLVFTNSSHGTYLAERNGDEPDYDEALCPYDVGDKPLVDDELREIFANVADGVRLTVVSDSCHSGTVTRAMPTLEARRPRFMSPRAIGRDVIPNAGRRRRRPERNRSAEDMNEVLLAACRSNQSAIDAVIDGVPTGAFTFHALAAIRAAGHRITYAELHEATATALKAGRYGQDPQLEGRADNMGRQIFT